MTKEDALSELKKRMQEEIALLKEDANNVVAGEGDPDARVMFIGEAPGKNEDETGRPFVGRAGELLDELLEAGGFSREEVFISNVVRYRPPGNRDPKKEEIAEHAPFLVEQIKIINPDVIATMGNFSTKFVLAGFDADGMKEIPGISGLHGEPQTVELDGKSYTVCPLYHPAAGIYNRSLRPEMEKDFKRLKRLLSQETLL